MIKNWDFDNSKIRNAHAQAARHSVLELHAKGNAYERLLISAEDLYNEIQVNRGKEPICSSRNDERLSGCIAEMGFEHLLSLMNVDFKQPVNEYGQENCPYTNKDFGDFEINGVVYDVKASNKHANVSSNYWEKRNKYIDYVIGSHIVNDTISKSCIIYFYGILEYSLLPKYDLKYSRYCKVISPKAFKPFPFEICNPVFIVK